MFNVLAFVEQVLVSFGLQAKKWLDKQRRDIESLRNWKDALHGQTGALMKLFYEWDHNKDGVVTQQVPPPVRQVLHARLHFTLWILDLPSLFRLVQGLRRYADTEVGKGISRSMSKS